MTENRQHIKDRMMRSAARFWDLADTDTEASFDPLVALLMGACATELEKINNEIDSSRSRVLERLVQLLSPEALTGVLPAHAIAYALPLEAISKTATEDQFYVSKKFAPVQDDAEAAWRDIYFSPAANFSLNNAVIKYKAIGNKIIAAESNNNNFQTIFSANDKSIAPHQLWLGIQSPNLHLNTLRFYFDVVHESEKEVFFTALQKADWQINGVGINHTAGYPLKNQAQHYFDIDAVLNRDVSATEKLESHIHQFYKKNFVTLADPQNEITNSNNLKGLPPVIQNTFTEASLAQLSANDLYWICISFPENMHPALLEEVIVSLNCFPVINRQLTDINFRLKEFINIIPLFSEDTFLDIFSITDQQGKQLHLKNNIDDGQDGFSILLRYGGVGRFDDREAAETVDKLIHLLREETAAFSILGNDFLQNEMTLLQQTINKLDQQITNKQLLKGNTPYLVINNNTADVRQTIYIKFWSSNGTAANLIKAGTILNVYSNSRFESGSTKLVTNSQGGRNKLNDSEKVLAYKSALLSKQKLVTNEDIAAFCRLRLAMVDAQIEIKKGFSVLADVQHGLVRTLDVHINLNQKNKSLILEKGNLLFWQHELEVDITENSNFFIPVKVFFNTNSN